MATDKTSKLVAEPNLAFFGSLLVRQALLTMNCHALGTVKAFNSVNQSAQVSINYKRVVNGTPTDYPALVDCPVVILGGGAGHLTFPIAAGDSCLVFFNDVNMDTWVSSGNQGSPPENGRLHSFSDAIILVGLSAFPQALADYFTTGIRLSFGSSKIELTSTLKLANAVTDLKAVIDGLIDLIAAITVTPGTLAGPSSPPLNAAAISAYKTTVAGLLT